MGEYGFVDDGFGNKWSRCKKDCALEIVRPGKVQCECDNLCDRCGEEVTYHPMPKVLNPGEGSISGYWCDNCDGEMFGTKHLTTTGEGDRE